MLVGPIEAGEKVVASSRKAAARLIKKNPSLSAYPGEYLPEAYPVALRRALAETGLLRLPETCPWTIDEILADAFPP